MLNDTNALEADAVPQPVATPADAPNGIHAIPNDDAGAPASTLPATMMSGTADGEHADPGAAAGAADQGATPAPATDQFDDTAAGSLDQAASPAAEAAADIPALALFSDTGLSEPILQAIAEKGYLHPTPIQAQAIPVVLAGRDVLGVAQTGTGKTASFVLPMMDILSGSRARARMPRSLILEPTRELALQVAENFVLYGKHLKLNHALLIGGESLNDQKDALMKGVDVLIATPGRLLDLFERGGLLLTDCRVLVIDEADRMLDMGFIPDVEKIVGFLPKNRQTLFFSATMSPEIERLTKAFLQNPKMITVSKSATVATTIIAGLTLTAEHDKREALRRLIRSEDVQNALIFCNRKRDVDVLHKSLQKHGFSVGALHGDMPQPARFATLEKFKANEIRLLVCSDVAARGIDIGGLSHVFNFDVPHHAEDYVHRLGRTGRAGKSGAAFTLAGPEDRLAVEAIEKLTGAPIPPIVVPGLDVVGWAETDGRKRRGRGASASSSSRSGGSSKSEGSSRSGSSSSRSGSASSREGRGDRAPRESDRAPVTVPDVVVAKEAEAVPMRSGSRSGRDRGRDAPVPRVAEAIRAEVRPELRAEPRVDPRAPRERRWRDDDLGPSVTGFGEDVPAFMKLPKRGVRVHEEAA